VRFCQSIVDVSPQRVQGDFSLHLFLATRNFRSTQPPTNYNSNALRICTHCLLYRLLHSATERDTLLQLLCNTSRNQERIQFGLTNLDNVQAHALLGLCLKRGTQPIDLLATLTDHNTRLRGMNGYRHLVSSGTFNLNTRN
jgi:hypothetical protein